MEGYVCKFVETVEELKETEFEYMLELGSKESILPNWVVTPEEASIPSEACEEKEIPVLMNSDNGLYTCKVKAYVRDTKTAYITDEVLDTMV